MKIKKLKELKKSDLCQRLYDIVCIADEIRCNHKISVPVQIKIKSIIEVSDIHNEFKK